MTLEPRVGRDAHGHVEVAGNATARRGRTAAGEAEALPVVDAGRYLDVDRLRRAHAPVTAALLARRGDAAPGGAAGDARCRGHDLAEDRPADLAHFTRTATDLAARRMGPGLATRALAALARDGQADVDGRGGAERRLREVEVHDRLGVGSARRTGLTVAERVAAEERVEDVAEPERLATRGAAASARACTVFAEDVVATPALRIFQRLVRDVDLLELRLGRGIGVAVGVVLARQRSVGALDLFVGRVPSDAEKFVVVGHESTSPSCCEMASTAASACR